MGNWIWVIGVIFIAVCITAYYTTNKPAKPRPGKSEKSEEREGNPKERTHD